MLCYVAALQETAIKEVFFFYLPEENLELMEDHNVIELIVDAIKMHKKVSWTIGDK